MIIDVGIQRGLGTQMTFMVNPESLVELTKKEELPRSITMSFDEGDVKVSDLNGLQCSALVEGLTGSAREVEFREAR